MDFRKYNRSLLFRACILSLLLAIPATAQDFKRYKPQTFQGQPSSETDLSKPKAEAASKASDEVLVQSLDAIIVLDHKNKVDTENAREDLVGVHYDFACSDSVVFNARSSSVLNSFIGQPITMRRLNKLSRDLLKVYEDCGQPITDVAIPEQKVTGGTVQIVVTESRIGQIQICGTCYTDECLLCGKIICSRPGERIYERRLQEDLYWLNRSPFRRIDVDLKPGAVPGTSDLVFQVDEVRPVRAYLGYDDTGVDNLRLERLLTGVVLGDPFGYDGTLGYQLTGDPEFDRLTAHAASYSVDLHRMLTLQTFGSWAAADPMLPAPLTQNGESWQAGIQLNRFLHRTSKCERSLSIGFDFKSTNNNLEFGGVNVQSSSADLIQLNLGYDYFRRFQNNDFVRWSNDLNIGPGDGFTSNHNAAAFNLIRAETDPTYLYFRSVLETRQALPKCMELTSRFVGQLASERLLFSEMLGFGGYDTIRGYDQRSFNGDSGWIASLELGPQPKRFGCQNQPHTLKLYTFGEAGQAFVDEALVGELDDEILASIGIGARYSIANKLTMRVDYGWALNDITDGSENGRLHLGVITFFGPSPATR